MSRFLDSQLSHAEAVKLGRIKQTETVKNGKVKMTTERLSARRNPVLVTVEEFPATRSRRTV